MVLCRDNGTQKVIYDETSPTYVERPERGTVRFIDGDRFLVMNETATGWNHIYLHSVAKGLVRPLTSGEWQVTGIAEVTDDAVYYLSTERSPLRRDLYAVDFKGKRKRRLTDRDGTYSIAPSKGMKYYISTFSSATEGNTVEPSRRRRPIHPHSGREREDDRADEEPCRVGSSSPSSASAATASTPI